ncbi:MAG: HlyD family efflux transporter periplasmic adaptor subunit, partial [Sedimentisphaerales bacterium]|nr:HlyD family efflux transporter periplasmic adaptor subunit [Sedimentisphaerales bacterium]
LVLTSPRAGVVSQILCRPGEAVMAGVPIMTIAETYPTEIIAFAGENQVSQIQVGMKVQIVKKSDPPQIAESEIIRIGPNVQLKPEILWRSQNLPERGRPCMIAVHPGMKLVPGEKVGIRGL